MTSIRILIAVVVAALLAVGWFLLDKFFDWFDDKFGRRAFYVFVIFIVLSCSAIIYQVVYNFLLY